MSMALASGAIRFKRRFHLDVDSMVTADVRDLLIETLVIRH
jgi:hypothetical protein